MVPSSLPGYCLCENGRRTAYSDCRHPPFTCQKLCASLPRSDCPLFDPSLRSNSAKGCSGSVTLQNRMKESVKVMWVSDGGTETLLSEIHPIGSYTVLRSISCSSSRSPESAFPSAFACTAVPITSCFCSAPYSLLTRSISQSPIVMVGVLTAWSHPEEPQPLAQALSYSLRSKGASIDFRWPLRSEAKQVRDEHFTMGISVESMYRDSNQTFSFLCFRHCIDS